MKKVPEKQGCNNLDESSLLDSIVELRDHVRKIEFVPEAVRRAQYLRHKLNDLENLLSQTQNQKNLA